MLKETVITYQTFHPKIYSYLLDPELTKYSSNFGLPALALHSLSFIALFKEKQLISLVSYYLFGEWSKRSFESIDYKYLVN